MPKSCARRNTVMEQTKTILNPLIEKIRAMLEPLGFEVYPFKVNKIIAIFNKTNRIESFVQSK